MKKQSIMLIVVLTMFLVILSVIAMKTDNLKINRIVNKIQEINEVESIEKNQTTREIINVLIPETDLVYRNESAGYQITFPESWQGNYVITEYDSGEVCVGFYGESKTGQSAYKLHNGRDGLDLFWIVKERPTDGMIFEAKNVDETEYFFVKWGGAYVPILEEVLYAVENNDNPDIIEFMGFEVDETEIPLLKKDLETAKWMRSDGNDGYVQDVIKTFTSIK